MFPKTFPKRLYPVKLRLCGVFLMPVGGWFRNGGVGCLW
nr:MAG TPA: hypothetical protein [Caudoviricetes sp.]